MNKDLEPAIIYLDAMMDRIERKGMIPHQTEVLVTGFLALAQALAAIESRLEGLSVNLVAHGEDLHGAVTAHREDVVKVRRRISADIPWSGKGVE